MEKVPLRSRIQTVGQCVLGDEMRGRKEMISMCQEVNRAFLRQARSSAN